MMFITRDSLDQNGQEQLDRLMNWRRFWGLATMLLVGAVSTATYFSLALGIRPLNIQPIEHVKHDGHFETFDPIALVLSGRSADSHGVNGPISPINLRVIRVLANRIELIEAGRVVGTRPGGAQWTLTDIARVADPGWLTVESDSQHSTTMTLNSALIVDGASLKISGADHLVLSDFPSVFIGAAQRSKVDIENIDIRSGKTQTASVPGYRPFIMATQNSEMNIINSRVTGLGWDWNSSYGTTWADGSTGTVRNSVFEENLIGFYANGAHDVLVEDSTFRHNTLYGIKSHTHSSHLHFMRVTAEHNGVHGIIFADHVKNSSIVNSVSQFNTENGVMMDKSSSENLIRGNTSSDNAGDGIVVASSAQNTIANNVVERNRVGVRVDPADSTSTTLTNNTIVNNKMGSQNVTLPDSNTVKLNGGQWITHRVITIWAIAGACWVATVLLAFVPAVRFTPRTA